MVNSIILVGRVSNDIMLKFLEHTGIAVCEFDIAVDRKNNYKKEKITDFFTIQVWGKYAETISNILETGQLILVSGSGKFEKWKDENNNKHSKFKVKADQIKFLDYTSSKINFEEVIDEENIFKRGELDEKY